MAQIMEVEIPATEVARIRSEIRENLAEMQRANERIKRKQAKIERLQIKTRATLDAIAALRRD